MSLTEGTPLPNITTNQSQTTTAPSWYTDYLKGIADTGNTAQQNAQYVGSTPLQERAFGNVAENVGNYQPSLEQASSALGDVGGMSSLGAAQPYLSNATGGTGALGAASAYLNKGANTDVLAAAQPYLNQANQGAYANIDKYMSPYVNDVVNQIGQLGQRQIQQNLAPGATAAAVGSGQFGSKRGAEVLGQTIRDANQNILSAQGQALNTGYQNAMNSAQNDLSRYLQSGQLAGQLSGVNAANQLSAGQTTGQLSSADLARQLSAGQTAGQLESADMANKIAQAQQYGNLANQTQSLGLGDVNALATLGGQQQTIEQNKQLFPLATAAQNAALLRGYSVPTSVASTYTGPIPGAYNASPLSQIAGVGSILGALSQTPTGGGSTALDNLFKTGTGIWDWVAGKFAGDE